MEGKDCEFASLTDTNIYKCSHEGHPYAKANQPVCHKRFCPLSNDQEGPDLRKMSKRL